MDSRPAPAGGVVAVAAALPMELAGLKALGRFSRVKTDTIEYMMGDVRGVDAALFVSGIGEERAYGTARAACGALPLSAYICVGFSGSLSPALGAGDIAVGVKVADGSGGQYLSDSGLTGLAIRAVGGDRVAAFGSLLALGRVAVGTDEKKALAEEHNCIAVDMESAGAARAAHEAGVPFIAIRVISDGLDEDLPVDFNRFTKDGAMDWPRLVLHVITHPGTIGPLIKLGRVSRHAAAELADVVARLMTAVGKA